MALKTKIVCPKCKDSEWLDIPEGAPPLTPDQELCSKCFESFTELHELYGRVFDEAKSHAKSCVECFMPIVQDENPGLYGEACARGVELLTKWQNVEQAIFVFEDLERGGEASC